MTPPVHVVILGPMGVGKTTVGTLVADRFGWSLVDSDRVIEALYGKTGREIVDREGVAHLHRIEAEVLDEALRFAPPSVIAPAASVADDAALLDRLGAPNVVVVVLTCAPVRLSERAAASRHRRRLDGEAALELMTRRRDAVESLAHATIDVTTLAPEDAAGRIVDLVEAPPLQG